CMPGCRPWSVPMLQVWVVWSIRGILRVMIFGLLCFLSDIIIYGSEINVGVYNVSDQLAIEVTADQQA
ncbi:MAG: hypothetical protein K8R06_10505, partial [Methanosarcinales archaeon]|nr:hypothetical protein [Methanosarcinales archaeon]